MTGRVLRAIALGLMAPTAATAPDVSSTAHNDTWPGLSDRETALVTSSSIPKPGWKQKQHDDVIKWKHFPRYWPFVRRIHWQSVDSPHKGQWRGDLMFSFICTRTNSWANNRDTSDLRRHRAHYDVTVMKQKHCWLIKFWLNSSLISSKFLTEVWNRT